MVTVTARSSRFPVVIDKEFSFTETMLPHNCSQISNGVGLGSLSPFTSTLILRTKYSHVLE